MVDIRLLSTDEISPELLSGFHHVQVIRKKWVKRGLWELADTDEKREWSPEKREWIPGYLIRQIACGGAVAAAFADHVLVGFCAVDGGLSGKTARYANMTMLFVDDDWKGRGIGRELLRFICGQAARMGAEKLFISAIPSSETVAFYFHIGCKDAEEVIPEYVDTGNDRFLEYPLDPSE